MSLLLEVRIVQLAVGRDAVEIEQLAAELVAHLSERGQREESVGSPAQLSATSPR